LNVFIFTLGTRGDVQPYVALGCGLKAASHRVTVCTSARFTGFITAHGLESSRFNDEFMVLVESAAGRDAIENTTNLWQLFKTARKLMKASGPVQRLMMSDGWKAAEAARPDLVVFHPKAFGGVHFAEKLRVPAVMALALPTLVPTGEYPALGFPTWPLGARYNRLTHRVILSFMRRSFDKFAEAWRCEHGLPPLTPRRDILHTQSGAPVPVLHGYSRHVAPVPRDWPPSAVTTGYWFLDTPKEWRPPSTLSDFIAAGDPPVYVGFGSMSGNRAGRRAEIVVDALRQAKVRGVLATGWGGLEPAALPAAMHAVSDVPHDWLFPRMAAVVHHGGAGTTAAGLRAGRPTVVCPFIADQPFWGRRVHALGAGPAPIPQKKLTAQNLAAAIREAVNSVAIREAARAIGEKIRNEDGIAVAVEHIERIHRSHVFPAPH
jgi:sterol 3beta-glucosyltransferase